MSSRGKIANYMFRLRIHSVDPPLAGETTGTSTSRLAPPPLPLNVNSKLHVRRGVVHLYHPTRSPSTAAASSSSLHPTPYDSPLPVQRGTVLFVLAVPGRVSVDEFLRFCGPYADPASDIQVIRNDAVEDLYSVLIRFDEQDFADRFYCDLNGWYFSDTESEVCHILFVGHVEFTEFTEIASTPPLGFTELPTCPVCLEKLDQDISGIVATTFDHSFPSASKWINTSCPVCQFFQEHAQKATCSVCHTSEHLWICLICGFVGCGRYAEGHARDHWGRTHHCYSLDPHAQRVWDYVGDTYVHRLNQSKCDGKLQSCCRSNIDNCGSCECSNDYGITGVLYSSQIEALKDEYNRLLASTLEEQKQHYEAQLLKVKEDKEKYISKAVENALSLKLQDIQIKLESSIKEKKIAADFNEKLMKDQNLWREKLKEIEERGKATIKLKDDKINELEEEIRDFKVYIEAQRALGNMGGGADDIRGGTLLPVPSLQPSTGSPRAKRSSKSSRRRT